ncbi:hypothetical protein [Sorangium sp. So ce1182]|uniref:hypothetical protein n=1 Tax=Sorangium sp. So ce1182 TaxID=3133334 RepID=UPI003F636490
MSNPSVQIVQKLWSYCNVLRDDGLSYGDYVEPPGSTPVTTSATLRSRYAEGKPKRGRCRLTLAQITWA